MKPDHNDALLKAIFAAAILGSKTDEKPESPKVDGDEIRKQTEDVGNAFYHVYLGFKDAGFNDEQAFLLMLKTISKQK